MELVKSVRCLSFGFIIGMVIPKSLDCINYKYGEVITYKNYGIKNDNELAGNNYIYEEVGMVVDNRQNVYLSEVEYVEDMSFGKFDVVEGTSLNEELKDVNNSIILYDKGNVVYDLTEYNREFTYFITYYDVGLQEDKNASFKVYMYTSEDGNTWKVEKEDFINSTGEGRFIKIDIMGKKYLRLYTEQVDGINSDYLLYANAKLVKDDDRNIIISEECYSLCNEKNEDEILSLDMSVRQDAIVRSESEIDVSERAEIIFLEKDVVLKLDEEVAVENKVLNLNDDIVSNNQYRLEMEDEKGIRGDVMAKEDWIDKVAPTVTIEYSVHEPTKEPVIVTITPSEDVTITNNGGKRSYVFIENGSFTFEFVDKDGNEGILEIVVDWIIEGNEPVLLPELNVKYSEIGLTNQDVVVELELVDGVRVINNEGLNTYIFTENGSFTFEYEDKYGNKGSKEVNVDWIDKEVPTAEVVYNGSSLTNQDVVATLTNESEPITVINAIDGVYIFTENGEYIFEFKDAAGNIGSAVAKVDWIDKRKPKAKVRYSITKETVKPVIVTVVSDEEVTMLNNDGKDTKVFTKNGKYTFRFVDKAGNEGSVEAMVNWIIERPTKVPDLDVIYSRTDVTDESVNVRLELLPGIKVINNDGLSTYTFKENGEFTFIYEDKYGNRGSKDVKVDWIEKEDIKVEIKYDINNITYKNVVATLETDSDIKILNNNGSNVYIFRNNGEFKFEYINKYGDKGFAVANVYWIMRRTSAIANVTFDATKIMYEQMDLSKYVDDISSDNMEKMVNTTNVVEDKMIVGKEDIVEEQNKGHQEAEVYEYSLWEKIIIAFPVIGVIYYAIFGKRKKQKEANE